MFDSGLGGLTVLSAVRARLPAVDVRYFADTAHVPYGDRALAQVAGFARGIIGRLLEDDPSAIAIACGTTCSAFDALGWPDIAVPLVGIVAPGAKAACAATRTGSIGVVATNATIRSGVFERAIRAVLAEADVTSVGAPALVPIVENGCWNTADARNAVEACCAAFRSAACDTLVLGCTHFPHLSRWFAQSLPGVTLVDPADAVAEEIAALMAPAPPERGELVFDVSGDPQAFRRSAELLMPELSAAVARRP
jgi:glutamate racemase